MKVKTSLCTFFIGIASTLSAQVTIDVNVNKPGVEVSPMLYGIFFEEINHAGDGGLYAELLRNRSLEGDKNRFPHYAGVGGAVLSLEKKGLLNNAQKCALRVRFSGNASGFTNEGFWGVPSVKGRTYTATFWAKGKLDGKLKVVLTDKKGEARYGEAEVEGKITGKWTKYTAKLTSHVNDNKAYFGIIASGKGDVVFDVMSLMPPTFKNRENGCRPDLAQLLYNLKPKFMRFPGGCYVEGQGSPDNAFHWERTIGPIEQRPGHLNANWGYNVHDGLGFHEFLQLAEDLGAKPLYVVNVGLWHGGKTPVDSLQGWIDECMNALEYANGDITTKYGAMRAANGHPAPFNIEYLEIGNENNQPDPNAQSDHYYERFKKFKDAVLAKYPHMHLIGNVVAWGDDNPKWESSEPVELIDEHYYRNPAWFAGNFRKYDTYSRKGPKVYCGEYAVTQGFGKMGNLNAALGEAVFMMGMENNSDIVHMASYAPIFVNENDVHWQPDMIRFNGTQVMCTPSYYVQQLMAQNLGNRVLSVVQNDPYSPSMMQKMVTPQVSQLGVATWSTQASFRNFALSTMREQNEEKEILRIPNSGRDWKLEEGVLSQVSDRPGCSSILPVMSVQGTSYTFTTKARKENGDEGFLIVFNYVDPENYCWLNLGGWGNTQHGIEQTVNGSKMLTAASPGKIETGKWYDVKVVVNGDLVKCYLNGNLVLDTRLRPDTSSGVYSSATLDESSGDVIVKIVNTATEPTTAVINLNGGSVSSAEVVRLTSITGTNENTIDNPTNVYPTNEVLSPDGHKVSLHIPAFSLNIARIKR
ncbi:MAG: arabinosidase [Prevotella sp.]|nr:MAG: arabinosidase [Prevotella sp.]